MPSTVQPPSRARLTPTYRDWQEARLQARTYRKTRFAQDPGLVLDADFTSAFRAKQKRALLLQPGGFEGARSGLASDKRNGPGVYRARSQPIAVGELRRPPQAESLYLPTQRMFPCRCKIRRAVEPDDGSGLLN
jgi:hypothetical protein